MAKDKLLERLNKDQKRAVIYNKGPLLIVAGAGTGKTTVITRRIAYIISKKWAKPSEIVALTFTEKSALEMEERVDQLVPYGFIDTQVSTFHSFASNIIKDYTIELKLPANFKVLTKTEQAIFLKENIFNLELDYYRPISNPISHIDKLLNHFSRLKDELVEPKQYLDYAQKKHKNAKEKTDKKEAAKILELAKAYRRYNDLLFTNGKVDYGDLIFLSYKLLKENPKIREDCQKKFKYILIDEFQDTNYAQYELVKLLVGNKKNITVVGDDDQSIYRFRGASISNILTFKKDFPNCSLIVLKHNYRSTKQILDHSYDLIQHNNPDRLEFQYKIDKKLISDRNGDKPELIYAQSLSAETAEVAKRIKQLKKNKKIKYSDFAILARANDHLKPFTQELNCSSIPFVFVGSSSLFKQEEIRSLIAFLKILVDPNDNLSYFQFLTSEHAKISPSLLIEYFSEARRKNRNLEYIFKQGNTPAKIKKIITYIEKYRQAISFKSAGEILYEFLKETNYFKKILDLGELETQNKIANIAKLFERINEFDKTSQNKSVISFLDNLELILTVGDEVQSFDYDPDIDAVNILTVHSSKGLEFEVVFLVNLVNERFPSRKRREELEIPQEFIKEKLPEGDYHLQEERRLFYVGTTRAKTNLFLTAGEDYGGKRRKKLSQFVLEFLDNPNLIREKTKLSDIEKIEKFSPHKKIISKPSAKKSHILKLSQSQIDDYYTCPKKYYYSNVIKIPLPVNWHFMYGTAIHNAVARYFRAKMRGQKVSLDDLIAEFEASYDNEGFITRDQEEIRHRKGLETLKRFFKQSEKSKFLPDKIEESFSFKIGNVIIRGRYDLVKERKEEIEIFDYKTSEVETQEVANRRMSQSTQMMIYALSQFVKTGKIPKTTLIFIESNIIATKKFTPKKLEQIKNDIIKIAKGIEEENYQPKPDKRNCQYCPFNNICPDSEY